MVIKNKIVTFIFDEYDSLKSTNKIKNLPTTPPPPNLTLSLHFSIFNPLFQPPNYKTEQVFRFSQRSSRVGGEG